MTEIPAFPAKEYLDEIPMLYAPLTNYVGGVIPLILGHIWFLKNQNGSSANTEMVDCGWLCRLITLDKRVLDPEKQKEILGWSELRSKLVKRIDALEKECELENMTASCMELLFPIVERRFVDEYKFPKRTFHCWWYTIHDNGRRVAVHLINAYQPESPFQHLHHFLVTMLEAIRDALANYPGIKVVCCGSWLNQVSKFQRLWPDGFKDNQKVLNVTGGLGPGVWGQYMTVEGGFNDDKAERLRRLGKHPLELTEAESPVDEVIAHLQKIISNTPKKVLNE